MAWTVWRARPGRGGARLTANTEQPYVPMTEQKPTRFEIRLPPKLAARIDDWRRQQSDLPSRAEAARRLIEMGLDAANSAPPR